MDDPSAESGFFGIFLIHVGRIKITDDPGKAIYVALRYRFAYAGLLAYLKLVNGKPAQLKHLPGQTVNFAGLIGGSRFQVGFFQQMLGSGHKLSIVICQHALSIVDIILHTHP